MAGQRKLMSEIDRTLKKVTEGVEVFNDIWDKVYSASAQNQKEKHEADLKKEIKKLQRFRDQIKNWIGNSDVKDKKPLTDARKLIEQKMEEFKVCEKETKTKAYSKEGLAQMDRLDPAEQARQNTRMWIQDCLTQFNEQIEATECDLERLQQSKGKNKNKSEMEALEFVLSKHKFHVLKLEQINRLLDNDVLDAKDVDDLKEDIEYYLEANQVRICLLCVCCCRQQAHLLVCLHATSHKYLRVLLPITTVGARFHGHVRRGRHLRSAGSRLVRRRGAAAAAHGAGHRARRPAALLVIS